MPEPEIRVILRAADDIIATGGRTLLSKILKGSKDRKLLELGLDRNPSYGFYKDLALAEIMDKVNRMIATGYLDTEKRGKLPMIVFSPLGWVIERERHAEEFLQEWDRWIESEITPISMEYLKERNRGMILLFLYKILCTGNTKYIPFLTLWEGIDFKKVQAEIRKVIDALNRRRLMDDSDWERLKRERAQSLLIRVQDPIFLACRKCGYPYLFDETNPDHYSSEGLRFPERCPRCTDNGQI